MNNGENMRIMVWIEMATYEIIDIYSNIIYSHCSA